MPRAISGVGGVASITGVGLEAWMTDRSLIRMSGAAGVVGGGFLLVFNALHPRQSPAELEDTIALLEDVVGFGSWTLVHAGILVGVVLLLPLFWAVSRLAHGSETEGWARLAWGSAVTGITVTLVWAAIDGVGLAGAAAAWATEGGGGDGAAFASADALFRVGNSLFALWQFLLIGFTPLLYAVAVRGVGGLSSWLSPLAMVAGGLGLVAGLIQMFAGFTVLGFLVFFSAASLFITVWVIAVGLALWRRPAPA
jgi:hypothetical protein